MLYLALYLFWQSNRQRSEAGLPGGRVIYTDTRSWGAPLEEPLFNRRDFIELHEKSDRHAGIIVCTQNIDLREQSEQIHQVVQEAGDMTGKLIRINRKQR